MPENDVEVETIEDDEFGGGDEDFNEDDNFF